MGTVGRASETGKVAIGSMLLSSETDIIGYSWPRAGSSGPRKPTARITVDDSRCRVSWAIAVKYEDRIWPHFGRFIRIDRPRLIEHTWMSEGTKGAESVVTVTMEPRGDETEVTLHHSGVPDHEMGRQHEEGWNWLLSALAEALAARPQQD